MTTRIVHVNDNILGAVYIGRPRHNGPIGFGNPYPIGPRYGDRDNVIFLYREVAVFDLDPASLIQLRGKPLACWCRHDGQTFPACHGDVLIDYLTRYTDDELRRMTRLRKQFRCSYCNGAKYVDREYAEQPITVPCSHCRGSGIA